MIYWIELYRWICAIYIDKLFPVCKVIYSIYFHVQKKLSLPLKVYVTDFVLHRDNFEMRLIWLWSYNSKFSMLKSLVMRLLCMHCTIMVFALIFPQQHRYWSLLSCYNLQLMLSPAIKSLVVGNCLLHSQRTLDYDCGSCGTPLSTHFGVDSGV